MISLHPGLREFIELLNSHNKQSLITSEKLAGRLKDLNDVKHLSKLGSLSHRPKCR